MIVPISVELSCNKISSDRTVINIFFSRCEHFSFQCLVWRWGVYLLWFVNLHEHCFHKLENVAIMAVMNCGLVSEVVSRAKRFNFRMRRTNPLLAWLGIEIGGLARILSRWSSITIMIHILDAGSIAMICDWATTPVPEDTEHLGRTGG
jgi:hypothetical protein